MGLRVKALAVIFVSVAVFGTTQKLDLATIPEVPKNATAVAVIQGADGHCYVAPDDTGRPAVFRTSWSTPIVRAAAITDGFTIYGAACRKKNGVMQTFISSIRGGGTSVETKISFLADGQTTPSTILKKGDIITAPVNGGEQSFTVYMATLQMSEGGRVVFRILSGPDIAHLRAILVEYSASGIVPLPVLDPFQYPVFGSGCPTDSAYYVMAGVPANNGVVLELLRITSKKVESLTAPSLSMPLMACLGNGAQMVSIGSTTSVTFFTDSGNFSTGSFNGALPVATPDINQASVAAISPTETLIGSPERILLLKNGASVQIADTPGCQNYVGGGGKLSYISTTATDKTVAFFELVSSKLDVADLSAKIGSTTELTGQSLTSSGRPTNLWLNNRIVAFTANTKGTAIRFTVPADIPQGDISGKLEVGEIALTFTLHTLAADALDPPVIVSVTNAASGNITPLSAESILTIRLSGLTAPAAMGSLSTFSLSGISALLDGTPLPLLAYNSGTLSVYLPPEIQLRTEGLLVVTVSANGLQLRSLSQILAFSPRADAFFLYVSPGIRFMEFYVLPLIMDTQGSLVGTPNNPVLPGSEIIIWGTGCGAGTPKASTAGLGITPDTNAPTSTIQLGVGMSTLAANVALFNGYPGICLYDVKLPANSFSGKNRINLSFLLAYDFWIK